MCDLLVRYRRQPRLRGSAVIAINQRYKDEFKTEISKSLVGRANILREGKLPHIRISEIKIDQQFVRPLSMGIRAGAIARGIILLGRELGLTVVAEGVED